MFVEVPQNRTSAAELLGCGDRSLVQEEWALAQERRESVEVGAALSRDDVRCVPSNTAGVDP